MSQTTPSTDVDVNSVFAILADDRRRRVLEHLFAKQSPVTLAELVDRLVTAELNGHEEPADLEERILVSLHHVHLPKLADSNLVDFDQDRGEVTLTQAAVAVEPYVALARDEEQPGQANRAG